MLEPIRSDIQDMKGDIRELKEDVQVLKEDVQVLQSDMEEVKGKLKKMEVIQEFEILPRLQTIESCYLSTYERYKESVAGYEELRQDNEVLKTVVAEHSAILQRIS